MTDRAQDTEAIRAAELLREYADRTTGYIYANEVAVLRSAADELARLVARLEAAERKIADADSYLADPAGNPIDAIDFARAALAAAAPGETEQTP